MYILTVDQWSHNPQLHTAIELRWLWAFSSIALTIGVFPRERATQILRWLASIKTRVQTRFAARFSWITPIHDYDSVRHRSISNVICHGTLPVYITRSTNSSESYSVAPEIPPLVRHSPLAPTLSSQVSPEEHQQPESSERDTRSSISQTCDGETIRPNIAASEAKKTSSPCDPLQSNRSSQQAERVQTSAGSILTLAGSTCHASSFGRSSSTYGTCEGGADQALTPP